MYALYAQLFNLFFIVSSIVFNFCLSICLLLCFIPFLCVLYYFIVFLIVLYSFLLPVCCLYCFMYCAFIVFSVLFFVPGHICKLLTCTFYIQGENIKFNY